MNQIFEAILTLAVVSPKESYFVAIFVKRMTIP